MMRYPTACCEVESTQNDCTPCEGEAKETISRDIDETYSILIEMATVLDEFATIVNGEQKNAVKRAETKSLWEHAHAMTALVHDNLLKLNEIKNSIV